MKIKKLLILLLCGCIIVPSISLAEGNEGEGTTKDQCKKMADYQRNAKTNTCDSCKDVCCGIKLNTDVPFIGNCITMGKSNSSGTTVTQLNAFEKLMSGLMQIATSFILIVSFLLIIVAGIMMTMGGVDSGNFKKGKDRIFKVAAALALLGMAGVILKIINPTFFT
ncbi:MAG: hypothetical protein PHU61_00705 [Candidatus Absconditabacteria bacterium]|nr:hypothetical protein [Candidatus Absconditabacteria bacterium]MDD3868395.1 hypothetical protein [Candidatus Absconditabacteria bacterium]MDD4714081.1 hypothetical protein [Candidatus Absconditabacteria bacterium]